MATTQVAMVEELASLIKDNLHSKHLVLSTEEALVALLQQERCREDCDDDEDDREDADTIELQPTGAYHRLLLHRLADIYGFAHESVGEGEDRHLVLQRCPETAIPPVLVSDMLWKYDNTDDSASFVLARNDTDSGKAWKADAVEDDISVESLHLKADADLKPLKPSVMLPTASLKEREAAYRAARERIFSSDDARGKDTSNAKCRQVPIVAQRMIAHALGKRVQNPPEVAVLTNGRGNEPMNDSNIPTSSRGKEPINASNIPTSSRNNFYPVTPDTKEARYVRIGNLNSASRNSYQTPCNQRSRPANNRAVSAESLKKEQTGAAKRMFAHALGLRTVQGSSGAAPKPK